MSLRLDLWTDIGSYMQIEPCIHSYLLDASCPFCIKVKTLQDKIIAIGNHYEKLSEIMESKVKPMVKLMMEEQERRVIELLNESSKESTKD